MGLSGSRPSRRGWPQSTTCPSCEASEIKYGVIDSAKLCDQCFVLEQVMDYGVKKDVLPGQLKRFPKRDFNDILIWGLSWDQDGKAPLLNLRWGFG